jgi:S-DNA-T family DNA segregation ATPase FtsK/SpoIIIE
MAWISIVLGLIFANKDPELMGGSFGTLTAGYLHQHVGLLVTLLFILLFLIAILILCYNVSPTQILELRDRIKERSSTDNKVAKSERKKRKKEEEDGESYHSHSDTKMPDLYITNRNHLADEYDTNKIHFKMDDTQDPEPKTTVPKQEKSKVSTEDEVVPFEIIEHQQPTTLLEDNDLEDDFLPDDFDANDTTDAAEAIDIAMLEEYDPRKDLSMYQFPPVTLLNDYAAMEVDQKTMRAELIENKEKIERTLKNFNILIKQISATIGPTVTLYEIVPADGVRISKIKNLEDDIALSLSALGIRIIAPIPGKGTIGIEVPNKSPNIVSMRSIIDSDKFQNNKYELPIGLGKTISNEPFVVDLAKMPHLLMAGATGQGKSVGLNAIITSLLYKKHPSELKFILVDPKKVEFTLYSIIENNYLAKLPDAVEPIITDTKKVVATLNSLCIEMDARYDLLKLAKTRNIKEYNAKFCARKLSPANGHRYLPYIVLIIDEFGDLIMTAGREVETPIARLAQLARAIGIHLIIATQRPSVNIITGIIKANFPSRIAFRVSSKIDSRTILDGSGADQLIGKGDMLISTGSDLIRLQCAFVDTPEVEEVAKHIENQQSYPEPFLLPEYVLEEAGKMDDGESYSSDEIDPMFVEAATLMLESQLGSTSMIQRKMKLGYNRAGRVMDQLEEFGIVGPSQGSKAREVKVRSQEELYTIFKKMGLF